MRATLDELKLQLSDKDADREKLDKDKQRLHEIQQCLSKAESRHNLEFNKAQIAVNNAQKEADKLSGVNCSGDGQINASCRFIKDAVSAKNNLPALIDKLNDVQKPDTEVIKLNKEKDSLSCSVSLLDVCNSDIKALKIKITGVESQISGLALWVTMLSEVNTANENMAQWLKERLGINIRLDSLKVKLSRIDIEKEGKLGNIKGNAQSELEKINKKIDAVTLRINERVREITECRSSFSVDVDSKVKDLIADISKIKRDISSFENKLQSLHVESGGIESKLDILNNKSIEVKNLKNKVVICNSKITNWDKVFRACSNGGIISLEIDDAGPNISSITNDLLAACYGSRFSVRFETQSENANGEMREDFDIVVFDSETEEKSIEEMSDGQITWLEDALTRAICLYNINKSGRHFNTLFSDEKDGALDEIKKMEFLAVKRKAIEIGGYGKEFFITQSSELSEIADSKIVLEKGTICIN